MWRISYNALKNQFSFFFKKNKIKEKPPIFSMSMEKLGIGTYSNLITVTKQTPLIEVLTLLFEKRISAVPIVDSEGKGKFFFFWV